MRAARLLSILLLLQVHRRLSARVLAERLEISVRTIHRDMDALSAAGVPVYAERGASGGWQLDETFRTGVTLNGLTPAEAEVVFLGAPARLLSDLGLQGLAASALEKLLTALPGSQRQTARSLRERIHVDATGWRGADDVPSCLATLQDAVFRERRLRVVYARADGKAVERVVDPLGLVAKGSLWYLVAVADGDIRTYRVSRVQHVEALDELAVRPPGFDLAGYWSRSAAEFVTRLPRYPARVRIAPDALAEVWTPGSYAHVEHVGEPAPDGWRSLDLMLETEDYACRYVLGFGPRMVVLEPEALRERVLATARATLELLEPAHQALHGGYDSVEVGAR
jgi:predicted DNA-binding transcriptional regulator YafY